MNFDIFEIRLRKSLLHKFSIQLFCSCIYRAHCYIHTDCDNGMQRNIDILYLKMIFKKERERMEKCGKSII